MILAIQLNSPTLLSKVRATFVLVDQERVLDCGGDDDGDDDFGRTRTMMRMEITMTELQFFTQIIFVQLNLPQRKSFWHLKYQMGIRSTFYFFEGCFEEKCHCSC